MQNLTTNVLDEIRQEVEEILKKHNLKWISLKVWETSDGFLVEVETPDIKDDLEAIHLSRQLEKELKDPTVSLSILPAD
jgi:pyruvate formate-lyase activating enzyme-like uncharacterized protein